MRKVLISACVIGRNVRWSGGNKRYDKIKDWVMDPKKKVSDILKENSSGKEVKIATKLKVFFTSR